MCVYVAVKCICNCECNSFMNLQRNVYLCVRLSHSHLPQDFVQGLSILSRGSVEEKLRWTFSLYDINGDGFITREEMTDIVTAIYELMGRLPDECPEEEKIKGKVEQIFQVGTLHSTVFPTPTHTTHTHTPHTAHCSL